MAFNVQHKKVQSENIVPKSQKATVNMRAVQNPKAQPDQREIQNIKVLRKKRSQRKKIQADSMSTHADINNAQAGANSQVKRKKAQTGKKQTKSKYTKAQLEKKNKRLTMFIAIVSVIAVIFFVALVNAPTNDYLKDIYIGQCTIEQRSSNGGYYLKLSKAYGLNAVTLSSDNSWIEVTKSFYQSHKQGDKVAAVFSNWDIYTRNYLGLFGDKGQTFKKNVWGITDIYDDVATANKDYPQKTFQTEAKIIKKKITSSGDKFFVLNYDNKDIPVKVNGIIYNSYEINESVNCDFISIGEFTKFKGIITQYGA